MRHVVAVPRRLVLMALVLVGLVGGPAWAGTLTEVLEFGDNPGNLRMFKYVPEGLNGGAPLVVALHGCGQTANDYDDGTGWTRLADVWRFALLLPEQRLGNNLSRCFNWFSTDNATRDHGEAHSIRAMVAAMTKGGTVDPGRIFVTGLSGGGAMANALLAAYPDVFDGGAVIAGIPYSCADGVFGAVRCMVWGRTQEPTEWGNAVRGASPHRGPWPRISIWQGEKDSVVSPVNAREILKQWTNVHGIDGPPESVRDDRGYPHQIYRNATGNPMVEVYTIAGMGHGTPIDPGPEPRQCGKPGLFIVDAHVCSTYHIARFWGLGK